MSDLLIMALPLLGTGLLYTVILAGTSFMGGLVLGTLLGGLRAEQPPVLGKLAAIYIELLRGIPLILFIVFMHYGVMSVFLERPNFFVSALVAFSLFEAAYIGEIVRSGFRSIKQSERDAAEALGLAYPVQLIYVYLPLVFSRMMPALVGQLITLVKDTSLASIVGVVELTRAGEIIYQQTYNDLEILLLQAFIYFVVCYSLSKISRRWEVQQHQDNAGAGGLLLQSIQG